MTERGSLRDPRAPPSDDGSPRPVPKPKAAPVKKFRGLGMPKAKNAGDIAVPKHLVDQVPRNGPRVPPRMTGKQSTPMHYSHPKHPKYTKALPQTPFLAFGRQDAVLSFIFSEDLGHPPNQFGIDSCCVGGYAAAGPALERVQAGPEHEAEPQAPAGLAHNDDAGNALGRSRSQTQCFCPGLSVRPSSRNTHALRGIKAR